MSSIERDEEGNIVIKTEVDPNNDLDRLFPFLKFFLHRPLLVEPPMCLMRELQDGTYSIDDLYLMHEMLDLKDHLKRGIDK